MRYKVLMFLVRAFIFLLRNLSRLFKINFEIATLATEGLDFEVKARFVVPGVKFYKQYSPFKHTDY